MNDGQARDWVLQVLGQVAADSQGEIGLVEAKREWPAPQKWSRQLGGLANRANKQPILLVVGLDDDAGTIHTAGRMDTAKWLGQLASCFDGNRGPVCVSDVPVEWEGKYLRGLVFRTDDPPYVVRGTDGGYPQYTVPMRDGGTRAADRMEIVELVKSYLGLDQSAEIANRALAEGSFSFEITAARFAGRFNAARRMMECRLWVLTYLRTEGRCVIPASLCDFAISDEHGGWTPAETNRSWSSRTRLIAAELDQLVLDGPGRVEWSMAGAVPIALGEGSRLELKIDITAEGSGGADRHVVELQRRPDAPEVWIYGDVPTNDQRIAYRGLKLT